MSANYVIHTSKSKYSRIDTASNNYYSHVKGMFSRFTDATRYKTFEEAQIDLRKLRKENEEVFINVLNIPTWW